MANQVKLPHTSLFSLTLKTMIINWAKDCNLSIHAYHVHFLYPIREGHILQKDLKITIDDQQYKCCGQNKQPEPHTVRLLLNINMSGTDVDLAWFQSLTSLATCEISKVNDAWHHLSI